MKKWAVYQSRSKYDHKKGFRKNPKGYVYAETEEQAHIQVGKHIFIPDGYWAKVVTVESEERLPCGHPVTDDYAHNDPNPGATHFCVSCAKESEKDAFRGRGKTIEELRDQVNFLNEERERLIKKLEKIENLSRYAWEQVSRNPEEAVELLRMINFESK